MTPAARDRNGYPPYDIELISGQGAAVADRLPITLAVAGFGAEELEILVDGPELIIRGRQWRAAWT